MATTPLNTIKKWFKTGLKPTQTQFWSTWDSFFHKDETIPQNKVENLDASLLAKADKSDLDAQKLLGFRRIGTYMVDRNGGSNTTIKAGNVILGKGDLVPDEYIIATANIDDPADENDLTILFRG